jgi:uncharacterized protein YjbJ (UPF0337 family)
MAGRGRQKARGKAQEIKGRAKEDVGRATGDRRLEGEGVADQRKGALKQAAGKLRDAFRR